MNITTIKSTIRRRVINGGLERNPFGPGFMLRVSLGRGAGYRAFDLPGYSANRAHRIRRHLSISGRTFRVGRNVKMTPGPDHGRNKWGHVFGKNATGTRGKFYITGLSTRANRSVFPGWW